MQIADRLKVFCTFASTNVVNMGAAAQADCRTLLLAVSSGEMTVGVGNAPIVLKDDAGNWEHTYWTITSSTQITRERIVRSSAGGAAPTYSGSNLIAYSEVFSDTLNTGMLDPDDVGFDIVVLWGQSNTVGRGAPDSLVDFGDSRMFQWDGAKIINGADPLYHLEGVATNYIGPGTWMAKTYLGQIPPHRRVLLVPCAVGGTSIVGGSPTWNAGNPGGTNYEATISRANAALTAAKALYPNSRVVGFAGIIGETDGDNSITQAAFATAYEAVVAGFRSRVSGASNAWFVIGGMCPEVISAKPTYGPIDLAHKQIAGETTRTAFAAGPTGYQLDSWHYNSQGARLLGTKMGLAIRAAIKSTVAPPAVTGISLSGPSSGVVSTASTAFTVGVTPSGGTISGTITVTPSDSSGGGAFSPTSVALTAGSPTATFTYTPGSTGTKSVSVTNNASLTNPSAIAYTVSAAATVPAAPTIGTAVAGDSYVDVYFTAGANGGSAILDFTATLSTGQTATGTTSPIRVAATNGSAATATVKARNAVGSSAASAASNSVTPAAAGSPANTFSTTDKDGSITLSNGNLTATGTTSGFKSIRSTTGKTSGKWYFEMKLAAGTNAMVGFGGASVSLASFAGGDQSTGDSYGYYNSGSRYFKNAQAATQAAYTTNDIIGVAIDLTGSTGEFFKNGVSQGQFAFDPAMSDAGAIYAMGTVNGSGVALTANFGATAFAYSPPAGFSAMN